MHSFALISQKLSPNYVLNIENLNCNVKNANLKIQNRTARGLKEQRKFTSDTTYLEASQPEMTFHFQANCSSGVQDRLLWATPKRLRD